MYFIFFILLEIQILLPVISSETIIYNVPKHYANREGNAGFRYKDNKIEITVDEYNINLKFSNDSRILLVTLDEIVIHYEGEVLMPNYSRNDTVIDNLEAYAELMPMKFEEYVSTNWRAHLSQFKETGAKVPVIYERSIRKVVELALEEYLANKYVTISSSDLEYSSSIEGICMIPIPPTMALRASTKESTQLLANKVVDKLIADTKIRFAKEIAVVPAPLLNLRDIANPHLTIKLAALYLYNGKARGLEKVERYSDAVVTNDGDKYTFNTSVVLTNLQLNYQYITISAGNDYSGDLIILVNYAIVNISASFDESVKPCRLKVEDIEPSKVGELDYDFTGFGILHDLAKWIADGAVEKAKLQIAYIVAKDVQHVGQSLLDTIDCEKLGIARV